MGERNIEAKELLESTLGMQAFEIAGFEEGIHLKVTLPEEIVLKHNRLRQSSISRMAETISKSDQETERIIKGVLNYLPLDDYGEEEEIVKDANLISTEFSRFADAGREIAFETLWRISRETCMTYLKLLLVKSLYGAPSEHGNNDEKLGQMVNLILSKRVKVYDHEGGLLYDMSNPY